MFREGYCLFDLFFHREMRNGQTMDPEGEQFF
jgi:hypothetical protein